MLRKGVHRIETGNPGRLEVMWIECLNDRSRFGGCDPLSSNEEKVTKSGATLHFRRLNERKTAEKNKIMEKEKLENEKRKQKEKNKYC